MFKNRCSLVPAMDFTAEIIMGWIFKSPCSHVHAEDGTAEMKLRNTSIACFRERVSAV
jgi:hypothetical protein